jgi:hypothetical protein
MSDSHRRPTLPTIDCILGAKPVKKAGGRMSGILWAITAGVGFGLFQAFHRRANQFIDAFGATFILLMIATIAMGTGTGLTQDLSVIGRAPATPVVVLTAPFIVGTEMERLTPSLLLGMAAVIGGSMLVVWTGQA